jgi:hypothetical protein
MIGQGYSQKIDDQFTLRVATGGIDNKEVLSRILDLNITVHGEHTREYIEGLFLEHPRREEVLWLYIEANDTGIIVSGLTLCPLEWNIGDLTIPICEMGFVGTLEVYRGKGYIVKLNEVFEKAMAERNYVFSVIRGIPYYYRRFGYEYVFPLDDRITLSSNNIPEKEYKNLKVRRANLQDLNLIQTLYENFHKQFYIVNKFDREGFVYRFFKEKFNDNRLSTYIIEDSGQSVAYFSIGMSHDNIAYTINVPRLSYHQMIKILQFVKNIHENKNNSDIQLHIRHDSEFGKFIFNLGGRPLFRYGWQLKIPNLELFFKSIKSIIEERIKNSIYKDFSRKIIISNYRDTIELIFTNGLITKITLIEGYYDPEKFDVSIPGSLLFKLLLSDKTMEEINYLIDDAIVKPSSKLLIDVMFPKKVSYPDTYF